MEYIWFGVAAVFGLIWAVVAISQKISGDRHQKKAQEFAGMGDWEQASLSYKHAILSRLDSEAKIKELVGELKEVYTTQGIEVDLDRLYECPKILKGLGSGTRNQKKKQALTIKLYEDTGEFLNKLPGPEMPA